MVLRAVAFVLPSLVTAMVSVTVGTGCARGVPVEAPTIVFVDDVGPRTLAVVPSSSEGSVHGWSAKDEVEVEWRGSWWPAVLLEQRGARWLVHYEGYSSDWDELVSVDRIRERTSEVPEEEHGEEEDEDDASQGPP